MVKNCIQPLPGRGGGGTRRRQRRRRNTEAADEDFSSSSPSVRSGSTFQLRSYSPTTNNSLFSPSRPILRPARLTSTSWVAGGYWTPPTLSPTLHQPTLSRTSSQSSGFVSATPSLANYNYQQLHLQPTPTHSLFSEPAVSSPLKLRRRTVESSISHSDCPDQVRDIKIKQTSGSGWTFTVTVTPTGILLGPVLLSTSPWLSFGHLPEHSKLHIDRSENVGHFSMILQYYMNIER